MTRPKLVEVRLPLSAELVVIAKVRAEVPETRDEPRDPAEVDFRYSDAVLEIEGMETRTVDELVDRLRQKIEDAAVREAGA